LATEVCVIGSIALAHAAGAERGTQFHRVRGEHRVGGTFRMTA
jgi:hypothetical protein